MPLKPLQEDGRKKCFICRNYTEFWTCTILILSLMEMAHAWITIPAAQQQLKILIRFYWMWSTEYTGVKSI